MPARNLLVLRAGDIELDRERCRVMRAGRQVDLPPTEFRLLEFLLENPGKAFSRQQLIEGVWGLDTLVDERTVDATIRRLRKPLTRGRELDPIRTVRGFGYAFEEKVSKAD